MPGRQCEEPLPNFFVPNLDYIKSKDHKLGEALESMQNALNLTAQQTNANPTGKVGAPPPIQKVNVSAANGLHDIQIVDNQQIYRGIEYFLEYSSTASFSAPRVIHVGTARNHSIFLGTGTFFWRAYSQYPTGDPSPPVYFGSQQTPTPVSGGGTITGPAQLPSGGSGTAAYNGTDGGAGYGKTPYRTTSGIAPRTTV